MREGDRSARRRLDFPPVIALGRSTPTTPEIARKSAVTPLSRELQPLILLMNWHHRTDCTRI